MWNNVAPNNILERRAKRKAYLRHLDALGRVRSTLDNQEPHKPVFLASKVKPRLLQFEKRELIQNDNNLLVDKMQRTQTTISNHNKLYYKVRALSQNKPLRRKQEREIDEGNELMIRKLQGIESEYRTEQILRNTDNYLKYRHNIMNSTNPTNSIFNASMYSSNRTRPFSASSRPRSAPRGFS